MRTFVKIFCTVLNLILFCTIIYPSDNDQLKLYIHNFVKKNAFCIPLSSLVNKEFKECDEVHDKGQVLMYKYKNGNYVLYMPKKAELYFYNKLENRETYYWQDGGYGTKSLTGFKWKYFTPSGSLFVVPEAYFDSHTDDDCIDTLDIKHKCYKRILIAYPIIPALLKFFIAEEEKEEALSPNNH